MHYHTNPRILKTSNKQILTTSSSSFKCSADCNHPSLNYKSTQLYILGWLFLWWDAPTLGPSQWSLSHPVLSRELANEQCTCCCWFALWYCPYTRTWLPTCIPVGLNEATFTVKWAWLPVTALSFSFPRPYPGAAVGNPMLHWANSHTIPRWQPSMANNYEMPPQTERKM